MDFKSSLFAVSLAKSSAKIFVLSSVFTLRIPRQELTKSRPFAPKIRFLSPIPHLAKIKSTDRLRKISGARFISQNRPASKFVETNLHVVSEKPHLIPPDVGELTPKLPRSDRDTFFYRRAHAVGQVY